VVDVDLEKFFDRVNHDVLMARLAKRVEDKRLLRVIRRYLEAGIMADGVVVERHEGTPQGGPLSPLLANVLLDEVDRMLERRGHRFVRYADDCNVYVQSKRAGERVMSRMVRLYAKLKLKVNEEKSTVARVWERKFLGYGFWVAPGKLLKIPGLPVGSVRFGRRDIGRLDPDRRIRVVAGATTEHPRHPEHDDHEHQHHDGHDRSRATPPITCFGHWSISLRSDRSVPRSPPGTHAGSGKIGATPGAIPE
jgi:hypothetical protein